MENLTFEKLPQAVSELHDKVSRIEQLLLERQVAEKEEEMFTVAQAAAFLKLSVGTVYLKVSNREIPVNKKGNRLYFYKSELEKWIKGGRKKTVSEIQQETQTYGRRKRVYGI
ncbi:helix-turn-helix domain-containing protein [Pontibacter mangrovi]|uniref:Helix-turn-helix domain-containing protein n=1 Tax=Pontibacter mangrovi TaxID=2589816 RepID=A0A501W2I3_9BACT|nr:helix-turn-helix domain-containing protein [Pontibacter mangrovi]TPE42490.1 helix-turn-helix domain-containing protein [Pontibacter mangrovi]